ncbi:conserved hypothetical protein [Histoplasma mississippiense (nom. inval.)]|uniref:conserved hypothetical protein n=1 Tax=Ajellomyces capsulatus (strain NAm1 / WU24) TaxID=2059318 RepID=UPI000157BD38|nr:conserved hypothetical protein [Histoplasma mississippiense (nom. inval.)]EDN06147.1 conserved hypothetical protein [Histoplasma mississippiense (nom. inval.)]
MPPIRSKDARNSIEIEGRLELAINAIKKQEISSISEAARIFNVPRSTLGHRLSGRSSRVNLRANSHKLTPAEEDKLVQWILDLALRGLPPRPAFVENMANHLLAIRKPSHTNHPPRVGKNWVSNLVARRPELQCRFSRRYNHDRAKCEDRRIVEGWFKTLERPGNREWVTAIESVNAFRMGPLPPYIILKGHNIQEGWFDGLPEGLEIGWLEPHILLILDEHGSHLTPEFDQICSENKIIPLCMPPHSSHLLQPLDVGVFAPLKRAYGTLVEQRMRLGFNTIKKADFLDAYPAARREAFKASNIQSGFRATGIVPLDPQCVVQQLNIQLRTPTPPASRSSNSTSSWILQTPSNPRQLQKQVNKVRNLMDQDQPHGLVEGFDQIIKACEYGMVSAMVMKKQYEDIFNANEKEKQKRKRSTRRIPSAGGLTRNEAQNLIIPAAEPVEQPVIQHSVPAAPEPRPRIRAPQRCSNCNTVGHTRIRCPQLHVI